MPTPVKKYNIKPCPCCKGKADKTFLQYYNGGYETILKPSITCSNCGLTMIGTEEDLFLKDPYDNVVKKWNRRDK